MRVTKEKDTPDDGSASDTNRNRKQKMNEDLIG